MRRYLVIIFVLFSCVINAQEQSPTTDTASTSWLENAFWVETLVPGVGYFQSVVMRNQVVEVNSRNYNVIHWERGYTPFSFGMEFHLNILERNNHFSLSLNAPVTFGATMVTPGNFQLGDGAAYGSVLLPLLLEANFGPNSQKHSDLPTGFYGGLGYGWLVSGLVPSSGWASEGGKYHKNWGLPMALAGYSFQSDRSISMMMGMNPRNVTYTDPFEGKQSFVERFYISFSLKKGF